LLNVTGPLNDSCRGGTAPAGEATKAASAIPAAMSETSFNKIDLPSLAVNTLASHERFSQSALGTRCQTLEDRLSPSAVGGFSDPLSRG
jgi:hypothetical protein